VDDIIQQLAERTGLPIDQAGKALEGLLSILKERLPGGLGEQVAALLSGQGGDNPLAGRDWSVDSGTCSAAISRSRRPSLREEARTRSARLNTPRRCRRGSP
jgi:hypothetical protein